MPFTAAEKRKGLCKPGGAQNKAREVVIERWGLARIDSFLKTSGHLRWPSKEAMGKS